MIVCDICGKEITQENPGKSSSLHTKILPGVLGLPPGEETLYLYHACDGGCAAKLQALEHEVLTLKALGQV